VIPGGVNSAMRRVPGLEGLVIRATAGATVTDAAGVIYTDFHCAFGPILLGHRDPDVDRAVAGAASRLDPPGIGATTPEVALAEKLCELVPAIERVHFTSSGSEATLHAVRLSRAATGRRLVAAFEGCYHGWHDAVAPASAGVLPSAASSTVAVPYNDAGAVERVLATGDVACVLVEAIAHNMGCVLPEPGFLERLRELCTRHGAVLVLDEVVTGFRHGLGGYQAIAGVTPDLVTMGKAMANGWPIACVGGRADLMETFSTAPGGSVLFAGTYNAHPATAAAALATIAKLEREPVHEHVFRLGDRARAGLAEVYAALGVRAVVAGFGSIFVAYLQDGPVRNRRDLDRNDADAFVAIRRELMHHGILELPVNLKRSHLSYAHTEADVDRLLAATEVAARTVLAA
jgi:glutamate-1-semialdehyde 2,1-aminomutase